MKLTTLFCPFLVFCVTTLCAAQGENVVLEISQSVLLELLQSNSSCSKQVLTYVTAIANFEPWAVRMLDATSKLQSGLLSGNLVDLGDFDECLAINATRTTGQVTGKHCLGTLSFPRTLKSNTSSFYKNSTSKILLKFLTRNSSKKQKLFVDVSICVPNSCSAGEVNDLLGTIVQSAGPKLNGTAFNFTDEFCQTQKDVHLVLDFGAVLCISFFATIAFVLLLATFYDYHLHCHQKKSGNEMLIALSLYTNAKKLFNTASSGDGNELSCLHGIRSLSILWIILGHTYALTCLGPISNMLAIPDWTESVHNRFIISADYCVDTFLVMSGALLTYNFMHFKKDGKKFNLVMVYLHRFSRITSTLLPTILVYCTLLKYFGSGPWWPHIYPIINRCNTYWWTTLLGIQNYYNIDELCISQSWYLSMDMQLFTLALFLLYPLWKWPKLGIVMILGLLFASVGYSFFIAWKYELHGLTSVFAGNVTQFYHYYYNATETRAGPYFIGMLLGYCIYRQKSSAAATTDNDTRLKLNRVLVLLLWLTTLILIALCIFIGFYTLRGDEYNKWGEALYISLIRQAWAVAVAWLIFACVFGRGGLINAFLSLPVFRVLGRLTYSLYIIHGLIILSNVYSKRVPNRLTDTEVVRTYWGHLVYSLALAVVWVLAFEFPVANVMKLAGGGSGKSKGSLIITNPSRVNNK